ncbi:6-bladed beta-propeller [Parabacteroides sp. 52]|uniref:6-bladed beta-propeller n=1 Tax=unclassified Parabacteroides TaxID=2649774 RepID=UPI0013D062F4|nr:MULTISPECIES: 6-bladed beta-propeller [unclassified Parabacteroides]MDH6534683.1 hypothetical protein [Parabacteroides sp. PM5-20]NDV56502.1 6-bladed beta-propeller [Parabacteroides sp. 52]
MKKNFTKTNIILIIVLFLFSCKGSEDKTKINIDLKKKEKEIMYSMFVDSLSYLELNTNDSCLVSDVSKIFIDNDTLILLDKKRGGVLIFSETGKLVSQINYYGRGPEEFIAITACNIDKVLNQIYILDWGNQKMLTYGYDGEFINSYHIHNFVKDFALLKENKILCIHPYYDGGVNNGVWIEDREGNKAKHILDNVSEKDLFFFGGIYTNVSDDRVYYYDKNQDFLYSIDQHSVQILYEFDLKQKIPIDERIEADTDPQKAFGKSMVLSFNNSRDFILSTCLTFGRPNSYNWVLLDKKKKKTLISDILINDIDFIESSTHEIFYLQDNLWCRIINNEIENCNLHLQFIHLPK